MLYLVISIISKLDPTLPICKQKKIKDGLSNPLLVDTLRGFYLE